MTQSKPSKPNLTRQDLANQGSTIREQTYLQAAATKFYRSKTSLIAAFLLLFIITISLAAPWLGDSVLGFDPTDTNLRTRNDPPTWGVEAWDTFQDFSKSCQKECEWSYWGTMFRQSWAGLQTCLRAELSECHWMGTDQAGRDVLTRGIYGGRISLRIGFYVALVSMTLGVLVGLISGYYAATWIDDVINGIIMTLNSIPTLFLLIILASLFTLTPERLAILIGALGWTGLSRLLRGQIFAIRERDYVIASQAIGSTPWHTMTQHVLPNVSSILIVSAVFNVAGAILVEASLSYLGVGIGPPHPSWGNMMQGSLGNFTDSPWLVLAPGFFIFLTTLSIYLMGDGLRDALDPWIKE